jgi:hypothetical protein
MSVSPATASTADDPATVFAVGALAATLAAVCHETLGHGLGCAAAGGHITLLTSIWFRCAGGSAITDAGGPMGNLVAGSAALALLGRVRARPRAKLLLLIFGAINMLWFTGQLMYESLFAVHDDWYWALHAVSPALRLIAAIVGIVGYVLVTRWVAAIIREQKGPQPHAIRLAYAAAAASAVIAGLMWAPEPLRSASEGFLTVGVAPLGLLRVARRAKQDVGGDPSAAVARSWIWISVSLVMFGIFLLVQARGLGSLAASRLS